ncbi:MAG: metal ABC transporter permease, partial [Planctomycetota bacterium]|nr:metal ABC transporter permease [Planctomycetota bacterium]
MDDSVHFWLDFWNVLTLRSSYNATLVILGTTSLGIASGIVGTFAVLRKRALMADAL